MTKRNLVIVDLDGTISDETWRNNLAREKQWGDYHEGLGDDEPFVDVIRLIRQLFDSMDNISLIGVTGRPEKWRQRTGEWLINQDVPLDLILMRPNNDLRPASEVKMDLMREQFGDDWADQVWFVMDDNQHVIKAFEQKGVTSFLVSARSGK